MTRVLASARGVRVLGSVALIALLGLGQGVPIRGVRAHELDFQTLQLIWDPAGAVLHGQVTTDPRRVAGQGQARADRLLAVLRDNLRIELDGDACRLHFEVRELWVRAGATSGDLVMVYCTASHPPTTLRVFVGDFLHGLQVTVQRVAQDAAVFSDRTLVLGGTWSPVYDFSAAHGGWFARPARLADGKHARSSAPSRAGWSLAKRYARYGVAHIVDGGWDHVAFVAALVLGSGLLGFGALLARLSVFTVAHSMTLALGAVGWVVLPRALVEPLIALSISMMALLNLRQPPGRARSGYALGLAFAFGLLHGQGFASVLIEAGLPVSGLVVALLAFNVGVEVGQALWACVFWAAVRMLDRARALRVLPWCSLLLAALGLYWTWQRLTTVLG